MDNDFYLLDNTDKLNDIVRPFQKELNRGQRLADFLKQCIRCAGRDDFLQLDELLSSKMVQNVEQEEVLAECKPLFDELRQSAQDKVDRYRMELIGDLTSLGKEAGLDIVIDFPRFSILKGIDGEIAFGDRTTTINKRVMKSIDPRRIVTALGRLKKELYDRPFEPEKYVNSLHKTYVVICKADNLPAASPVAIQRFYLEYVISLQSKVFFTNMEKSKFRGYSLEQFSVDLWRCFESGITTTSQGMSFKLTSGRNFCLWLLDSTGQRKQISSISFQESK
ncbi:MAG: hypothetical protein JRJ68_12740 [Deltaproteobacteria bacterium]|nr:hypothetical protein [Deltaproteobacteria bacterium]